MDREMLANFRTVQENNLEELLGGVGTLRRDAGGRAEMRQHRKRP